MRENIRQKTPINRTVQSIAEMFAACFLHLILVWWNQHQQVRHQWSKQIQINLLECLPFPRARPKFNTYTSITHKINILHAQSALFDTTSHLFCVFQSTTHFWISLDCLKPEAFLSYCAPVLPRSLTKDVEPSLLPALRPYLLEPLSNVFPSTASSSPLAPWRCNLPYITHLT